VQRIDVTREAALGLDLEEAGDVRPQEGPERPRGSVKAHFKGKADNTFTLAHTCASR
jgi:hypothetical protein